MSTSALRWDARGERGQHQGWGRQVRSSADSRRRRSPATRYSRRSGVRSAIDLIMSNRIAAVLLVLIGAGMALVASLPPWVRRPIVTSLGRGQARMRMSGERNPYFGPDTDQRTFLHDLRVMALVGAVLALGLAVLVFASG